MRTFDLPVKGADGVTRNMKATVIHIPSDRTLRDDFAIDVMKSLLCQIQRLKEDISDQSIAAAAYKMADAMLAEREK